MDALNGFMMQYQPGSADPLTCILYTSLVGKYVNLEYRLPNGQAAKFLNEAQTYLGNQLECEYGGDRCFGVVADIDFILICTYEEDLSLIHILCS